MKDPGPNVLEQQIETNRLLALILAAGGDGAPAGASYPGVSGGGCSQWPTLFAWCDEEVIPFETSGTGGYDVMISEQKETTLSHNRSLRIQVPAGTGSKAMLEIGPPMGLNLSPRIQLAWMSSHWPISCTMMIELLYDNGVNLLTAGVELEQTSGELRYRNSSGVYTMLGEDLFNWYPGDWIKADLAVNFGTGRYSYAAANGKGYDISAQAIESNGSTTKKRLRLNIQFSNSSSETPNVCYLDEILVTDELYTGPAE